MVPSSLHPALLTCKRPWDFQEPQSPHDTLFPSLELSCGRSDLPLTPWLPSAMRAPPRNVQGAHPLMNKTWILPAFTLSCETLTCFLGHHASPEASDLHHQGCRLYCCHLDHGYLLLSATCHLPETVYLQVQVRRVSWNSLGLSGECTMLTFSRTHMAHSH